MTSPVPTRFSPEELAVIDLLVAEGVGTSRSDVIRRAVKHLNDVVRRDRAGKTIAESYRTRPQSPEDDALAMASALAMTESEPW